ncbi:MAG TPA: hypothetical protein DER02_04790 [Gammaproteobacteria bacterium]|nr:hypothetical protein [Gammaproteobacteria bacterium]|tara:strand:+ start:711 stop:1229 length:519 start_codon:yes stop_codon:yes gene_type:complete
MIASEILPEPDPSSGVVGHVTLQPNNSMSWRALKWFLLFMMTVSFSIAITLTVLGYWVVLIFTTLEMAVLSYCLWLCVRRSSIQEVISFGPETVTLEVGIDSPQERHIWQRFFTTIEIEAAPHPWYRKSVALVHRGERREVGKFLPQKEQEQLIKSLRELVRKADEALPFRG